MEAKRLHLIQIAARTVLTVLGAALLWWSPESVAGLGLMLVGLICAVSGLLPGAFVPGAIDALSGHLPRLALEKPR